MDEREVEIGSWRYRLSQPWIAHVGSTFVAMVAVMPILLTPYLADDATNRTLPTYLAQSGTTAWEYFWAMTSDWAQKQGRFFPGSVLWGELVFLGVPTRETYKLLLLMLSLLAIGVVAQFVRTYLSAPLVGAATVVSLVATWSFRAWAADGLHSFAGLLPLTITLTFACLLLVTAGRSWPSLALGLVLWSSALITYEVAILMTPALVAAARLANRGWPRSLAPVWPALVTLAVVLSLRSRVEAPAPAYQTSFEPQAVVTTYVRQLLASVPLSQLWYPGAEEVQISTRLILVCLVVVSIPAMLTLTTVVLSDAKVSWRGLSRTALVGGWTWLAAPLLVAVTRRWQEELPPGQGYLAVVWGYVGCALLLVSAWLALVKIASASHRYMAWFVHAASCVLAIATAVTCAVNIQLASQSAFPGAG
jgi:hypothetical protein